MPQVSREIGADQILTRGEKLAELDVARAQVRQGACHAGFLRLAGAKGRGDQPHWQRRGVGDL